MPDDNKISAPDLTKRPPRSPRQRLGGYVLLPRMLDKGRAEIAGTSGEYHYNCPLDQRILNFLGLDPGALREQLATSKGDGEILRRLQPGRIFLIDTEQGRIVADEEIKEKIAKAHEDW